MEQETQGAPNPESGPAPTAGETNKLMAILAYIGPLVIVSYLVANKEPFVNFHIKQGLVLLVIWAVIWALGMMVWMLMPFIQILQLAIFVLAIIGIVNASQDREKELPVVGSFAKHFNV